MKMEDLNDLIFAPCAGEFDVAPSASFKDMADLISNDHKDDLKEIEEPSCWATDPTPKFDDLIDYIRQDGESNKENETDVQ